MENRILITATHHPILIERLRNAGFECDVELDIQQILKGNYNLNYYCGIIISNNFPIRSHIIDKAPKLKFIGRLGSGTEIIDVAYADSKNIQVFSSPEGNANAVGEHALGMLLNLLNHIGKANNELRKNIFERKMNTGNELNSLTVGIIGLGNNGSNFANKLALLGVKVLAYDIIDKRATHPNISICSLEDIYQNANCVSLHIPLNTTTKHIINNDFIQKMKYDFILINCARGALVHTNDLFNGIISEKISGACIDVWEQEPICKFDSDTLEKVNQMLQLDNVIATPHIAGYSYQATYKMSEILAEKIIKAMH